MQVNISGEESKHGFSKEELLAVLPDLSSLDQIEYVGLMTMAPFEAETEELQKIFKETQELQRYIREGRSGGNRFTRYIFPQDNR